MTQQKHAFFRRSMAVALSCAMALTATPAFATEQGLAPNADEVAVDVVAEGAAQGQSEDLGTTTDPAAGVQVGEAAEQTEEVAPSVEVTASDDSVAVLDTQSADAQEPVATEDAGANAASDAVLTPQADAATPSVTYRTHVQRIGWQGWRKDGAMSGTSHKSLRLEAIQIQLYGDMANSYDVWYRVHAQQIGWMGWAKNGEQSGTAGFSWRLEGIQVVITPKGSEAPSASLGNLNQATDQPFCTHTNKKYRTLSQLGIKYGGTVNAKVDKALNALTRWCAVRGVDINAKGTPNYHKAYAILAYVGTHYRYANGSYSAESMIDKGNGTCFAFSDLVMCFARKVGLTSSWLCVPGRPVSSGGLFYGSQHRTVVSKFDGQYYDLDGNLAIYGFFSPRPISESYAQYLLGKTNSYQP